MRNTPENNARADPALTKMVGWFIIFLSLPLGYLGVSRALIKIEARHWPAVPAEVVTSEMYHRGGRNPDWCLKLSYRYVVDGHPYIGTKTAPSIIGDAGCHRSEAVIAERLAELPPGASITAFVDAKAP